MRELPNVRLGLWTDHDRSFWNSHQVTWPDWVCTIVQLSLGVLFGLTAPSLTRVLFRVKDWFALQRTRSRRARDARNTNQRGADEEARLLGPASRTTSYGISQEPSNPGDPASASRTGFENTLTDKPRGKTTRFFVFVAVFVGWALAGGLVAIIPTNEFGISSSTNCGVWTLKDNAHGSDIDDDDLIQASKEIRAGEYARTCYSDRSLTEPGRCNVFARPTIPYHCTPAPCPFADDRFCWGTYGATRCSTGLIDASYLGINSDRRPKFNRTTVCTPLDMDAGFVDPHFDEADGWLFDYYLGSTNRSFGSTDYTFRQYGKPFQWAIPAYLVNTYHSSLSREDDRWKPLTPQLDRDNDTYLTVIFIVSARIFYTKPSTDYIFHATDTYLNTRYLWNIDPESHPLACVDHIEVHASDGTSYSRIDKEHSKHDKEYEFLRATLNQSSIYHAIQARGGNALDAQEKVRDTVSLELAQNQSAVESELLFATSLARIQWNTWDIATGFGHENVTYEPRLPKWARGKLCGLFKYKLPKGYGNINIVAYAGFVLLILFVILLGYETSIPFEDQEEKEALEGNKMIFEWLWRTLIASISWAWSWTIGACLAVYQKRKQRARSESPTESTPTNRMPQPPGSSILPPQTSPADSGARPPSNTDDDANSSAAQHSTALGNNQASQSGHLHESIPRLDSALDGVQQSSDITEVSRVDPGETRNEPP